MSTDRPSYASLVERLRSGVTTEPGSHHPIWSDVEKADETMAEAASALEAERARADRAEAERDAARQIVRDIYWMALRYADGRKSYAVGMCNDAIRKGYDAGWLTHKHPSDPAFARDGMTPEYASIENRAIAAEAARDEAVKEREASEARAQALAKQVERKDEALRTCQRALAHLTNGKAVGSPSGLDIMSAYAQCVEAEAKARAALETQAVEDRT